MFVVDTEDRTVQAVLLQLGIENDRGPLSWYELLGAPETAAPGELMKCWSARRADVARDFDPDSPAVNTLRQQFDRALECLASPERRGAYDQYLARVRKERAIHDRKQSRRQKTCQSVDRDLQRMTTESSDAASEPADLSSRARFEPMEALGTGTFGTRVFKAYEYNLGEVVVVKALPKDRGVERQQRDFLAESVFLSSLQHPHVVKVHDINSDRIYRVEEYLPRPLTAIRECQVGARRTADAVETFLKHALSGLLALHERHVCHGELTTSSFRVTESGTIKLTGAPNLRSVRADERQQGHGQMIPLKGCSSGRESDRVRYDLYCLGFVAVQLLAGPQLTRWFPQLFPGAAPSTERWRTWHASREEIPPLEIVAPEISVTLRDVISGLCAKQRMHQFDSARAALDMLKGNGSAEQRSSAMKSRRSRHSRPQGAIRNRLRDIIASVRLM